jgi:hypothetical protein
VEQFEAEEIQRQSSQGSRRWRASRDRRRHGQEGLDHSGVMSGAPSKYVTLLEGDLTRWGEGGAQLRPRVTGS